MAYYKQPSSSNKIKLRKCVYCSSYMGHGNLAPRFGWVVMGFQGSEGSTFIIPKSYQGLPIIGIHFKAYEEINEYTTNTYDGCWKERHDTLKVCFYMDNMLFVFPPRRYSDRRRMDVHYVVTVSDEHDRTRLYRSENMAGFYCGCIICYNRDKSPILNSLQASTGHRSDYGYGLVGEIYDDVVFKYKVTRTIANHIVSTHYEKEKVNVHLSLSQSCEDTRRSAAGGSVSDKYWPSKNLVGSYSFDMLWVGKYFRLPPDYNVNIQQMLDSVAGTICFMQLMAKEQNQFAFNTIPGTDVSIPSETSFPRVSGYSY